MTRVTATSQIFEAIARIKGASPAFCTNFFPVEARLRSWIAHDELFTDEKQGAAFFLRKDRAFFHLYFSAATPASLEAAVGELAAVRQERLTTDLVGKDATLGDLVKVFERAGFRKRARLIRLARVATAPSPQTGPKVEFAADADCTRILELLETCFDPYADQLPLDYEIRNAISQKEIFVVRQNSELGAVLYFETQGVSSVLRFWVVAPCFRSAGLGSAILRHYFASQTAVRRFILWVNAANESAVQKYQYYGYAPDHLADEVLVNPLIP